MSSINPFTRPGGVAMTVLRQRMIEDMQVRGLAARTREAYVTAVEPLAKYHRRSPDEIAEDR
jgi:integrase/recombinase XerD